MPANIIKPVFADFLEYWYFAKELSEKQRETLYASLPYDQRIKLEKSFDRGGWHDVIVRNKLGEILDRIKEEDGYDLVQLRVKVLSNKSVYLPRAFWSKVLKELAHYKDEDTYFILGGMKAVIMDQNERVILLLPENHIE